MRLFLMTLFIWVGMKLFRHTQPSKVGIIISIFLAAIIFGLGHLPITASLTTITTIVVIRAIVLNGIGGIVFGWLYWKKGLESAMIAHFTTDVFLLTLIPLLFQ
jgi:membrane protease YdiL (CAAX protease family)